MHSIYILIGSWLFYCYKSEHGIFYKKFKTSLIENISDGTVDQEVEEKFDKAFETTCSDNYKFGCTSAQVLGVFFYVLGDLYMALGAQTVICLTIKWWIRRYTIPAEIQKIKDSVNKALKIFKD
jgi:hypothetical protein